MSYSIGNALADNVILPVVSEQMSREEECAVSGSELAVDAVMNSIDRMIALAVLIVTSPLLAIIFVLHRTLEKDGGPFLYRGERVGKNGKRFTIFKVRTLVVDAEKQLHGKLHGSDTDKHLELRMGPFLRETRLDELPQMINVLKGDMALVGPRPERPSVYKSLCKDIPGYHRRFSVLPGVTGLSQFLTPHGTAKRMRARVDMLLVRKMKRPVWRVYLVAWTGYAIARKLMLKAVKLLTLRGTAHSSRCNARNTEIEVITMSEDKLVRRLELSPAEIASQTMLVFSNQPLQDHAALDFRLRTSRGGRNRTVHCAGAVVGHSRSKVRMPGMMRHPYLISYRPVSRVGAYSLDRHVLGNIVAA